MDLPDELNYLGEEPQAPQPPPLPGPSEHQVLPFGQIPWQEFEKLCWRLIESGPDDLVSVAPHGTRGQAQSGIDVLARRADGRHLTVQCRHIQKLNSSGVESAVKDFREGHWADTTAVFALATTASANDADVQKTIEAQAAQLREQGVQFEVWDDRRLSTMLHDHRELVRGFFGQACHDALFPHASLKSVIGDAIREQFDRVGLTGTDEALPDLGQVLAEPTPTATPPPLPATAAVDVLAVTLDASALGPDVRWILEQLRQGRPEEAVRLTQDSKGDPATAAPMIRAPQDWVEAGSGELWDALGRLAMSAGAFADAETAFLRAEATGSAGERVARLVRAHDAAKAAGREDDAAGHLARAGHIDSTVFSFRLATIADEDLADDARLAHLNELEPSTPGEIAAHRQARADALAAAGRHSEALQVVDELLADDPDSLFGLDRKAGIQWVRQSKLLEDGLPPDWQALRDAAALSLDLRNRLLSRGRTAESGALLGRAADCLALAAEREQAAHILADVRPEERAHATVRHLLAQAAMHARRPDLVSGLLGDETDWADEDRSLAAGALLVSEDPANVRRALAIADDLWKRPDHRLSAAFIRAVAASEDVDLPWPEEAEQALAEERPVLAAQLRAARLTLEGDDAGADAALAPFGNDPEVLRIRIRRLLDAEDSKTARALAETLIGITASAEDRLLLAAALRGDGEDGQSEAELLRVTHDRDLPEELRRRAFLASGQAIAPTDFSRLERLSRDWIRAVPSDDLPHWQLAYALAHLARPEDALIVIGERSLEPDTPERAILLSQIMLRALPAADATRRIAELSDQFDRSVEELEVLIIAAGMRVEDPADEQLRQRIADTLHGFEERFPESRALVKIKVDENDPEALAKRLAELAGDRSPVEELALEVAAGNAAVAALADVVGRHIGQVLLRLSNPPIGYGQPALDETEIQTAGATIGAAAVWDPAALTVVALLPAPVRDRIAKSLPGSVVAASTLAEVDAAATLPDAEGEQTLLSAKDGQLQITTIPPEDVKRERDAATGALDLARGMTVVPDVDPANPDPLDDLIEQFEGTAVTWPATAGIARRRDLPLYSDDRYVRLIAHRENCATFGTLAVLDALTDRALITPDDRAEARQTLIGIAAAGTRWTAEELITLAQPDDWALRRRWPQVLFDSVGWREDPDQRLRECVGVLRRIQETRPDDFVAWTARVIDAACRSLEATPVRARDVVAFMVLYAWVAPDDDPEYRAFAIALLRATEAALRVLGLPSLDVADEAATTALMLSPPALRPQMARLIVRRLPFPQSAEFLLRTVRPRPASPGGR